MNKTSVEANVCIETDPLEVEVCVRSIPAVTHTSASKIRMLLQNSSVLTRTGRAFYLEDAVTTLISACSKVLLEVHERAASSKILSSYVKPMTKKISHPTANKIEIDSQANARRTKYQLLGEMDSDGSTYLTLAKFDNDELQYVDYIDI